MIYRELACSLVFLVGSYEATGEDSGVNQCRLASALLQLLLA